MTTQSQAESNSPRLVRTIGVMIASGEKALLGLAVVLALGPAVSAAARWLGQSSSPWLDVAPRYATLAIGFLGASLATRHGKHIRIDLLSHFLTQKQRDYVGATADGLAATLSALLSFACVKFLQSEREAASIVLGIVPTWWFVAILVWGFGIAALRFAYAAIVMSRALALLAIVASALLVGGVLLEHVSALLLLPVVFVAAALGAPLYVVLGGIASALFLHDSVDLLAVVPVEIFRLAEAPALTTLPLFTLIGGLLSGSGAPARLVNCVRETLGFAPGGLVVAVVAVCAVFTTFTGASGVTILALGLLLQQLLTEEGYDDKTTLGLITSSGSIGLLFAPALPLIVYGIVAKIDIEKLFVAGIKPGILLMVAVATTALVLGRKRKRTALHFDAAKAKSATRKALWDLALPVLIIAGMVSGATTVVEAAALAVVYTLATALWVHRDLQWTKVWELIAEGGVLIGSVLVVLGVAVALTGYLIDHEIPQTLVQWTREHIQSRFAFLLLTNLLLLVVGCLLDIFSAIVVFVPLLAPVGAAFGVDPVHLAIIFLANLELGYLTPPVGMNLFLSSHRFSKPLPEVWRAVAPYVVVMLVVLMIITYWPALSV